MASKQCWTAALFVILLANGVHGDDHWPRFRGPGGRGIGDDRPLPTRWDTKTNILWQVDVPGRGWSSPIVWGDRVFVTAVLNDKTPTPRKGLYIQDLLGKVPPGEHVWKLYCYDFATGKLRWERTVHKGTPGGPIHLKNTYASETPVTDGAARLRLLRQPRRLLLRHGRQREVVQADRAAARRGWAGAPAARPIVHEDRLYLVNDNEEASYLLALDKRTGKEVWHVERDEKSTWGTPLVWQNKHRTEIVTAGTRRIRSYDLDGKLLWELSGMSSISIPSPFAHGELLYVTSGYVLDPLRPLYAIKPGATGDISLKDKADVERGHRLAATPGRAVPSDAARLPRPGLRAVRQGLPGQLRRPDRQGDLRQATHRRRQRQVHGVALGRGRQDLLPERGRRHLRHSAPARSSRCSAKNSLDEMCLATPALSRGSIVLRTMTKLYRIGDHAR